MKLNYKIWLEDDDKVFGDGPCDILKRIDRLGSLSQAAREINMSYSQAWGLINDLENRLGFKLLEKHAGGTSGGGSKLTPKGRYLMETYRAFKKEAVECLEKLEDKWFGEGFQKKISSCEED